MSESSSFQYSKPKRILLKLTGESFCPANQRGICMDSVNRLAEQIVKIAKTGVQIAVVMGGGNILRGAQFKATNGANSIKERTAHYMGMLATIMNGLALLDAIEALPDIYRQTLLLYYYEDMKAEEIAKIQHTARSTVNVRLKRGRDMLRKALSDETL